MPEGGGDIPKLLSSIIKRNGSAAQWPKDIPTWRSQLDTRLQTAHVNTVNLTLVVYHHCFLHRANYFFTASLSVSFEVVTFS